MMMGRIIKIFVLFCFVSFLYSCEKDSKNGNNDKRDFIVAFKEQSIVYSDIKTSADITLVFSDVAMEAGSIEIDVLGINATYGIDFSTLPVSKEGRFLEIPFQKGDKEVKFTFENLIYPYDRTDKTVQFNIVKVNYSPRIPIIQGYSIMAISFDAALGGTMAPNVGGPSEPNQVYVDLGGKAMYPIPRDSWDLAFYSGEDFRVKINGALYMAAGETSENNIDNIRESDVVSLQDKVKIGTFDPANVAYIDDPSGDLNKTAIGEVKLNSADNKVYIVNLGSEPGKGDVAAGSVDITGAPRGWMKIRVLRKDNGYVLQYAELNDSTHKEIEISKNAAYNFRFFSFNKNSIVDVEPAKNKWDLNFTVFTNVVDQNGDPKGSYGFSDFIAINRYGGVESYKVTIPKEESADYYKKFSLADVKKDKLEKDLTVIGGTWREVANSKVLFKNVFYVVKDSKGNFYKMRMLSFMDESGRRGYPKFEYSLLR